VPEAQYPRIALPPAGSGGEAAAAPEGASAAPAKLQAEGSASASGGGGGMALLTLGDNQAPVAVGDSGTTNEDTPITLNVLANDSDPDGNHFFITSAGPAAHGKVVFTASTVTYTPDPNTNGPDSFSYTITDGHFDLNGQLGTATATVSITVNAVADLPIAGGDYTWVSQTGAIDIPVKLNDSDAEGAVTVTWVQPSTLHLVAINADETIHYDGRTCYSPYYRFPGQVGWSTLSYQITDNAQNTANGTILIYTASDSSNDPPFAGQDFATIAEDCGPVTIGPLGNDWDPDGGVTLVSASAYPGYGHGTVSYDTGAGTITYTPDANYNGLAVLMYQIRDGSYTTAGSYVNLTITPVNDNPVANPDTAEAWREQPIAISPKSNDTDVDGDTPLILTTVTRPDDCDVWFDENQIHFTALNTFDSDSAALDYTVADGHGGTDGSTATVHVNYVDLDIKDLDEQQEDDPGGLVVKNADNNNAPRQEIIMKTNWSGNVVLTKTSYGGGVRVFDASTAGNEITFNGMDNVFPSNTLPRSLYVEGSAESLFMRDIALNLAPQQGGGNTDSVNFTVLWVDPVELRWSSLSEVSNDNDKRGNYNSITIGDSYALGLQEYENPLTWAWGTEAYGLVHPVEFDYSYIFVGGQYTALPHLDRDAEVRWWLNNGTPLGAETRKYFDQPAPPPPGNDVGDPIWRDDNNLDSNPVGFIYDLDTPGIYEVISPVNEVRRFRANFKAFASIQLPGQDFVRASPITTYFIAFSIKQMDSPNGNNWQLDTNLPADNNAVYRPPSPRPVTWNLQQ